MKLSHKFLCFSLLLSLVTIAQGGEPLRYTHEQNGIHIVAMQQNSEDAIMRFKNSYSDSMNNLEYVFNNFEFIQIFNEYDLVKAENEFHRLGYIKKYCGTVLTTGILKKKESAKSPLVELVMATQPFSQVKVVLPFRSLNHMKMESKTLDYYSNKYSGKFICADKVMVGNIVVGGINYILPYDFDQELIELEYQDKGYVQLF